MNDLKLCKNAIPTWDSLIPLVLERAATMKKWNNREFKEALADQLGLSENLRYRKLAGGEYDIEFRAGFAISALKKAGLIIYPSRGHGEITNLGNELFRKLGTRITEKDLKEQPKFKEHMQELSKRKAVAETNSELPEEFFEQNPEEAISQIIKNHENEVANELLQKILDESPSFFEKLVVKLLTAMGYKGANGLARTTSPTNDKGIDGIIEQDALGINAIYIQAKRYKKENNVGRPDINEFYGSLALAKASKGVFITTSSFSSAAIEAASAHSIVLIDGVRLTDLMLQYGVGVRADKPYYLYKIDENFFVED